MKIWAKFLNFLKVSAFKNSIITCSLHAVEDSSFIAIEKKS